MNVRALLFLALLGLLGASACDPLTQHDPARWGRVEVWIDPAWLPLDQRQIRDELGHLDALGPDFIETSTRLAARVEVRPFESTSCFRAAARWRVGSRVVEIDRTCMTSESSFRQAVGHEIGHALGMHHVCEHPDDARTDDCSPAGFGLAMMGPKLRQGDDVIGFGEVYTGVLGTDRPTDLDLAEFRRVYAIVTTLPTPTDGGLSR